MQMLTLNNAQAQARYEARARIIKALAHPTRLFIVDVLAQQSHCVCELTAMVGADTSTVSKHLSLLKDAGLVSDEKRGTQVYYHLVAPCALRFLDCAEAVMKVRLEKQLAAV
ncbi:MAG TPA: metalloregulator ArsR/SmtB family transcription factor [Candidatus Latescibacteria bacterium]|jgi:ArsR family transcriptional regulator|nr:metalloregulator ArsR/SmtB family transcription factor [Candidatus Latescibacterota bacterium]HOM56842.1 metalloregulator ArsR/SmtB family transcription factor [Candidatus Latescibacterota bacterium]HOS63150.1 metalloregulator ArsR/SmtB family transcription factor [Candidatus Latescibacterota bacterium]HOT37369.1 metalloregulator ArsR/SmtB family transcription factor [Candidatus Latescibacterota bacterium]HPC45618.1 metalloregulator ArsR/SmtB family transcription factor [Candidatus Latesciba